MSAVSEIRRPALRYRGGKWRIAPLDHQPLCATPKPRVDCEIYNDLDSEIVNLFQVRLQGVSIENKDAIKLMLEHDSASTLHYVDPPYVHATRSFDCGGSHRAYRFEMTDNQHADLARTVKSLRGMVVVSGYRCALYDELYAAWQRVDQRSHADGARPRIESLWLNPRCAEARPQQSLLDSLERGQP